LRKMFCFSSNSYWRSTDHWPRINHLS